MIKLNLSMPVRKNNYINIILFIFLAGVASLRGYTNLSTNQVHTRLMEGDSVLLLDVREVSEYTAGHIAEPSGQLPLTPVNMPWSSSVLSADYDRLPRKMDIIVYCKSGGRSAQASTFLEGQGFIRIFNMTGGFSSWPYENRRGGYGDHSGHWVHSSDLSPIKITCLTTEDTSQITFTPGSISNGDSIYIELHFASNLIPVPPKVPQSDAEGLFRITALDRFGLSHFDGDSISLSDIIHIHLSPNCLLDNITFHNLSVYVPEEGWQNILYSFYPCSFQLDASVLRRWYNAEIYGTTSIQTDFHAEFNNIIQIYPNPFNHSVQVVTKPGVQIHIFDAKGRWIQQLESSIWSPDSKIVSGIYFIRVQSAGEIITGKVVYLK